MMVLEGLRVRPRWADQGLRSWAHAHNKAIENPANLIESAWHMMMKAVSPSEVYSEAVRLRLLHAGARSMSLFHVKRFDWIIEDDRVLGDDYMLLRDAKSMDGDNWNCAIDAMQSLLNGEHGRLDAGTVWSWLEEQKRDDEDLA